MFDKDSVGVAKGRPGGYAAVFPVGTDISVLADPSKTLKELIGQYHGASLGYISEDGVTFTTDTDSEGHNDWGGSEVARDLTSYADSAQMTFIQSSVAVLKTIYGDDNVTESGPTVTVRHNRNFTDPHVYVFDSVISSTKVLRNVIPIGQAFERDDVSYSATRRRSHACPTTTTATPTRPPSTTRPRRRGRPRPKRPPITRMSPRPSRPSRTTDKGEGRMPLPSRQMLAAGAAR